ncbi:hypothetical protein PIB30_005926 [Stylosanthes scabra]|uniref:Uncharacterized protein n=1 Tax=Stylosanthes scabra TaxID=79078 RepID=A0ABU6R456_9FABA|nr:hypothetical protein [Stylosanthes scabra]
METKAKRKVRTERATSRVNGSSRTTTRANSSVNRSGCRVGSGQFSGRVSESAAVRWLDDTWRDLNVGCCKQNHGWQGNFKRRVQRNLGTRLGSLDLGRQDEGSDDGGDKPKR